MTLSVRCFRLLSSMCRTSEIDGRCVHFRGSDRCEISYAATLTRSMCRSTFEDPIGVNFIIMLLYSCMRIYAEGLHFSAFHYSLFHWNKLNLNKKGIKKLLLLYKSDKKVFSSFEFRALYPVCGCNHGNRETPGFLRSSK